MYQNKKPEQTAESAQYGLDVTFKLIKALLKHNIFKSLFKILGFHS